MPLTAKGEKIEHALEKEYGAEKGKQVLYAGKNAGTFTGIDAAAKLDAILAGARTLEARVDLCMADDHRVLGGVGFTPPSGGVRRDAGDKFEYDREGSQWRIFKNGEKYGPPVESEEAAQRVVARLKSQSK